MCNQRVVECFRPSTFARRFASASCVCVCYASYDLCGHNLPAVSFDDVLFEHTHTDTRICVCSRTCVIIYLLVSVRAGESVL